MNTNTELEALGLRMPEAHGSCAHASTLLEVPGHCDSETQNSGAGTSNPIQSDGHWRPDNHVPGAVVLDPVCADEGQRAPETQPGHAPACATPIQGAVHHRAENRGGHDDALDPICDLLRELHRQRQDLHRAEKSLTLQIKAKLRRMCDGERTEADRVYKSMQNGCAHELAVEALAVCAPFITARSVLEKERKSTEKHMEKKAKELPVYAWVEQVRGFGALGLAQVVGEAGSLSNYATVSKLWKRLGLAVINGERQQRKPGAESLLHGYSPSRRSVIWTMGDSLFRANGEYADVCRARKEREREKAAEEGLTVAPSAKIPAAKQAEYRSDGHIHNRAKRYMEKRLIRDLWAAWRRY